MPAFCTKGSFASRALSCILALVSALFPLVQSVTATSAIGLLISPISAVSFISFPTPAFAVDYAPAVAAGASAARATVGTITPPTLNAASGSVTVNSTNAVANGQVMSGEQMIPQSTDPAKRAASNSNVAVFGDKTAMGSGSATNSNALLSTTGPDAYGDAYKTIRQRAVQNSHPNLKNDPVIATSTAVYNGTDSNGFLASMTSACQTTTTPSQAPVFTHIPDLQTCQRTQETSGCRVTRPFKSYTYQGSNAVFTYKGWVKHYMQFEVQLRTPDKLTFDGTQPDWCLPYPAYPFPCPGGATLNPEMEQGAAVKGIYFRVTQEQLSGDWPGELTIETVPDIQWPVPDPGSLVVTSLNLDTSGSSPDFTSIQIDQTPSDANGWIARFTAIHWAGGDGYLQVRASLTIGTATPLPIIDDPLDCSLPRTNCEFIPVAWTNTGSVNDLASTDRWQCINASMDRKIGIVPVTPANWGILPELYPGEPTGLSAPICYDAVARKYQCSYPSVPFPVDTCSALEDTPGCNFLRSECLPEHIDPVTGRCIMNTLHFDCGTDVAAPNTNVTSTSCGGPIRCMGTECTEPLAKESNADFNQAAAQLGMVQWMDSDKNCTPGGECTVFNGTGYACRNVFFGAQNCCDTPTNTTLADYIKLSFYTYKVTNWSAAAQYMQNAGLGSITSGFQALGNAVSSTWSDLTQPIVSAWQDLASNFSSNLTDAVSNFTADTIKDTAKQYLLDWGSSIFGPEFVAYGGEAAVSSMVDTASVAIEFISTFMMYYAIAMILISIIWACTDQEFELATKRELKSCHPLGSYCSSRILGVCYENSNSYCCYASPLGRIIQEQVRAQLGLGWPGPSAVPSCPGLTVPQLQAVNWSAVDLTEWLSYLQLAGLHPTDAASADAMYASDRSTTYINAPGTQGMTVTDVTTQAIGSPTTPMTTVHNVDTKMWGNLP
jgi:hypothetical protein